MSEVGVEIFITLDGEHLVNESFTSSCPEADDALCSAIEALQSARTLCDERAEEEWEAMMDRRRAGLAAQAHQPAKNEKTTK